MPKSEIKLVCVGRCRDGKGGIHKVGDKVSIEKKEDANSLIGSGRFLVDNEENAKEISKVLGKQKAPAKKEAAK